MKRIPDWLQKLPHGTYTLRQLFEISTRNTTYPSLCRTLANLGLKKEYFFPEGSIYREARYTWNGKIKE